MTDIELIDRLGRGTITCVCCSNTHYAFVPGVSYELIVEWTSKEVTFVKTGNGYRIHSLPSIYDFIKLFEIEGLNDKSLPLQFLVNELALDVK